MAIITALGSGVTACGATSAGQAPSFSGQRCDPSDLGACERALGIALAEGRATHDLVGAYLDARASRDATDPWVRLRGALPPATGQGQPRSSGVAILVEGAAPTGLKRPATRGARWVESPELPAPDHLDANALLLALGDAAGLGLLVHVRGRAVHQLFPADPLRPFLVGLPPLLQVDPTLASLDQDASLDASLREAFTAAGAFHYVDAARAADRLAAAIATRDPNDEPVLRARYALFLLANAGVALEPLGDPAPPPPEPTTTATTTPYADLLRVHLASKEHEAWKTRGASVLRGIRPERQEAITSFYGQVRGCAPPFAPPMEDARDLMFASRLASALAPLPSTLAPATSPDTSIPAGSLPLSAWLPRYESMVDLATATGTVWAIAPRLLLQRGDAHGLSLSDTPLYKRVTDLGLAHLTALKQLAAAEPARFRTLSIVLLAYAPGALGDERLRDAVAGLTQTSVQRKLAAAEDAAEVANGVLSGLIIGTSYPPALQTAHFTALQGAITAKLRGDMTKRTGWDVAGLYAADALYRVVTDQAPDVSFSAAQVARALASDAALPFPGLGQLAASLGRYAALGVDKQLDPDLTDVARFPAERRKARDDLQRALASLADEPAPAGLLDDLTTFADGLIALGSAKLAHSPPAPDTCADEDARYTPAMRRALARLGDVRRRILLSPRYRTGDGAWIRRARMVTVLLSDAMDLMSPRPKGRPGARALVAFSIPKADAQTTVAAGLRDWNEHPLAGALTSTYGLARAILESRSPEEVARESGALLPRTLATLHAFFRDDAHDGSAGVALFDALAQMPQGQGSVDLRELLLGYARAFTDRGQRDQADLWLLVTLLYSALGEDDLFKPSLDLAQKSGSRTTWMLHYLAEAWKAKSGKPYDPSTYAEGMRSATDDTCTRVDAGPFMSVLEAGHAFSQGRHAEARKTLDGVLDHAEQRGLTVPRITYRYDEKTATRVLSLSFKISYGSGLLENGNAFQLGLGLRTPAKPEGTLSVQIEPDGGDTATEDTASYYVHLAALAAAYHYLDGDRERGATAARRAISTLTFGLRLGDRAHAQADPVAWGSSARGTLALTAQLAAEAGQPLLAGDLWTVLRPLIPRTATDAEVNEILDTSPLGLASHAGFAPLLARTRRSLAALAEPLPCTSAKVELGHHEEPTCEGYPLALSLRAADALTKLPRLRRGNASAACGTLRHLDAFLTSAERGTYDPDAFTRAVEALRTDGLLYDAAVLLTRQRQESHCSPTLTSAARALGRAPAIGPALRADALSVAVNCTSLTLADGTVDDLLALHAETRNLPDLNRHVQVMLFMTDLAQRESRWDLLARLTEQPEFVERWLNVSPRLATAALLITHVAGILHRDGAVSEKASAAHDLLCKTFPPGDRAPLCNDITALRAAQALPKEQRQRRAEQALRRLLEQMASSP
ncbi:uncharacterized protein CMC5_041930 [Chondromyces crocatus]|uniref:Uncharacterized protein n=2 Tax=Chondromyces crocatus TaxID=52 RepID=A0A0K1EGP7_CHOCO|nr:uncharacterized protein CMC5_041930 [Chondromyces crocatus]